MPVYIGTRKALLNPVGVPSWASNADMWKDFVAANGNMPDPIDTHAATIYAPNAAGLYLPFAANVLTRTDLGLQTVPTRTQLSSVSPVDFTAWANTNLTVAAAATTAPDGTLTGSLLDDAVATGVHSSAKSFSAVSGTTYTASFLVRDVDRRYAQILFGSAGHGVNAFANFDLQTGALGTVGSAATATITAVGGWYLITCTAPAMVTASGSFQPVLITSATSARAENYTGTNKKIYAWSGQGEVGSFAPSRILTASATVNGNQQVISGLGTQLATGVAGLIQWNQLSPQGAGVGLFQRIVEFNPGGTALNFVRINDNNDGVLIIAAVDNGGVTYSTTAPGFGTGIKTVAFVVASNYLALRIVGSAASTVVTTLTFPVGMHQVELMGRFGTTDRNNYAFTRKIALDFLTPGDDPATKFAEWYAKAQLAAAA